jgi:aryl-alcohol dehydrogenase-like predicted oxidoreductase
MEYIKLGKTDLKVSVACLGCGGSSTIGKSTGKTENQSINLIKTALDLGVNFFDTANVYGTEKILGKAIKNVSRDQIVISTKHQISTKDKKFSSMDIISGIENSLKELKTDYIDIFHLHGVAPKDFDHAISLIPELMREKEKGKFRFLGITESSPIDHNQITISKALNTNYFDVMMLAFSIMNQNAKKEILPKTMSKNIGTMCMFVVRSLFSVKGRLKKEIDRLVKNKQLPEWLLDEKEPLEYFLKDSGANNIIDACYRYVRHQKGIDTVLFGTGDIDHLKKNIRSIVNSKLSDECINKFNQYFSHLKGVGLDFPERNK